jgi:hypothetical protein
MLTTNTCFDYLLGLRLGSKPVKTMPKGFGNEGSGGGMKATVADMDFP